MYIDIRWVIAATSVGIAFGSLSILVAIRRLHFLAGGLPHGALVAVLLGIIAANVLGIPVHLASILFISILIAIAWMLLEKGVSGDVVAAAFVSFCSSVAVILGYMVLSLFPLKESLWAYIWGDILLVDWNTVALSAVIAVAVLITTLTTYIEHMCIAVDGDGVRLAGVRIGLYDLILLTMLAATSTALLKAAGFVLEHVLILLPGTIAVNLAKTGIQALLYSLVISLAASLIGLLLGLALNQPPSGLIGLLLFATYIFSLHVSRRK
ncbi:MAG TPA: metal ABC transporter permease [Pyrodictium sp.]|nr:metal ABC transporter permease [Pyrodictium sp.]